MAYDPYSSAWGYKPSYVHPLSRPVVPSGNLPSSNPFQPWSWAGSHPWGRPLPPKPPKPIKTVAPPVDSLTKILQQLYGSIETPAQQEARAQREAQQWYDLQKQALQEDYDRQAARAQAMAAAQQAAGMAAAGMSGDLFAAVGGEYNRAAREIQGLSSGLTAGAAAATSADQAKANEALARVSPLGQITEGGPSGIAGPGQATVEDYRGGTLPGQLLTSAGQAETFGLAGMAAAQNLAATQNAQAQLMTSMRDINDNEAKAVAELAAGRADRAHQYLLDAQDARVKAISLIQGITAQQATTAATLYKAGQPLTRSNGRNLLQYNRSTGKWDVIATAPANPTKPTFKNSEGYVWRWTPKGWVNTGMKVDPKPGKAPTGYTMLPDGTMVIAPGYHEDPRTHRVLPNGWKSGPGGVPVKDTAATGTGSKKGQLTQLQIKNMVESWATGKVSSSGTVPVVVGQTTVGTGQNQHTVDVIRMLKPGQPYKNITTGKDMIAPGAPQPRNYQDAYRTLVALGVSPEQALGVLQNYYKRGTSGRSWLTQYERAYLQNQGVDPRAHLEWDPVNKVNHGYLTRVQVQILRAAGGLPRGEWNQNRDRYYIYPGV